LKQKRHELCKNKQPLLTETPKKETIEGDDDTSQSVQHVISDNGEKTEAGSLSELVQMGMSFFGRLTETLSNPEATQKLISSIV
jgi:hypothetical protein